jgi:hypothetical protein
MDPFCGSGGMLFRLRAFSTQGIKLVSNHRFTEDGISEVFAQMQVLT